MTPTSKSAILRQQVLPSLWLPPNTKASKFLDWFLYSDNTIDGQVIEAIGNNQLSVKGMMQLLSLADRENFLNNYLNPAIKAGFVRLLHPGTPRHPRQKYLLTVKGLAALQELQP